MEMIYASEQRFWGTTDTETIQNAVDYAEKTGIGKITIPRFNERTGEKVWNLDKAVLLPSDMTVILDSCHLRHADDSYDNLFRNKLCYTEEGCKADGEQHDIRIIGVGTALLDGGKGNGRCEQLWRDNPGKYPPMVWNSAIHLANVRNFEVRGLKFYETRYWAVTFHFCRWGLISDLYIENHGVYENQDGIDLRMGCEYITIQNISGMTGDDTVALTTFPWSAHADGLKPENKSMDIHDITITNITSSSHGCGVLRFLCEGGNRIYNVTVDGIKDTTNSISGTSIIVGTADNHFADPPHVMGDFKNISIRNITTCAQRAITLSEACQDVVIENLFAYGPGEVGIRFTGNFECDNMLIRNVAIRSHEESLDTVFAVDSDPAVMKKLKIENVYATKAKYVFRKHELPVENLTVEEPSEAWFTEEPVKLKSAYGRYHYMAWGKVIQNRPADNRYDGTLRTPAELAR